MREPESVTLQLKRAGDVGLGSSTASTDAVAALANCKAAGQGAWRYQMLSDTPGLVATLEIDSKSLDRALAVLKLWCDEFGVECTSLH